MRSAVLFLSGLCLAAAPMSAVFAQSADAQQQTASDLYGTHIAEASQRFGIPASWIRAVLRAESAGDPHAISSAGAMGLMQIMPATWAELRARHRLGSNPYDARDNILAGTAYLRELHDRYGSVVAMLAAYNAGPGRYEASLAGRPLPPETRAYIATIAPVIDGGSPARPVMAAAAASPSWTHAPLFIAQSQRAPAADPVQAQNRPDEAGASQPGRDEQAITAQADGLFIARAKPGTMQ
ncbi:lytic transglycosylase domain-containing protein [Sphingobium sp.]|uniref:lytic transglycosylase domain-containing protein n=1 Tax=Sphingobium sp. TaxID=1912891 RepID=UPI00257D220C|nr:lytic transglycosylase domain-containing protein [Sphingobium sp.]